MFIRRDRRNTNPYTGWRIALFFLAAGIWMGGVLADNRLATGIALGVLLVAVLLGIAGRGREE